MQEGLEGNPVASTMKKVSMAFAVLFSSIDHAFPKCLKLLGLKKALGVPDIPVPPPSSTPQPSFDMLFSAFKQDIDKKREEAAAPLTEGPSSTKVADQRVSSSSVLSQRIRSLEL